MYCTVSRPIKVQIEIKDLETECCYLYQGKSVIDCEKYFLNLFTSNRKYIITWVNVI